jgi:Flp pilus assembly pilin Flp
MTRLRSLLRRLRDDERGVQLIEFAIGLPFFLVILVTGLETVNLVLAHQQVSRIATATADLAARYRASIDESDVVRLFLGANLSASGIEFNEHGRLILSSVMRNQTANGHWIRWQRCQGDLAGVESVVGEEGAGQNDTTHPYIRYKASDDAGMVLNAGDNVMYAEATYEYQPLFLDAYRGIRIRYAAGFLARELALPTLTNSNNLANAQRALCQ